MRHIINDINSLPATSNDPTITKSLTDYTFDEAQAFKKEAVWQNLSGITINQAIAEWLTTLARLTAKNYASGITRLSEFKLINLESSLQAFALVNHEAIIDRIKTIPKLSECSKQA